MDEQTTKKTKSKKRSQKPTKSSVSEVPAVTDEVPQVIDLDDNAPDGVDLIEPEKPNLGMRLHTLNVRLPWLKVALLILLAGGVAFGVEEILRHNVSQPVGIVETDVAISDPETTTLEQPEVETTQPEEEKPVDETPPVTSPEESKPEQPVVPVAPVAPVAPSTPPSTGRKLVALTFDDGPSATQTPRLLQILREKNVKATFFVVGNMAQRSPDILRQEEAEGHEVASHTMTHANLKRSTIEGIKWEAAAINGVFMDILGHGPSLTRPPYGNISNDARIYINQPLILWTVDPEDWRYKNAATVRRNVVSGTFDGAIVLMHDIHATTVDAVAGIIDDLRAQGYEFMTVSELAAARGVVMQNGTAYGSFRP